MENLFRSKKINDDEQETEESEKCENLDEKEEDDM